MANSKTHTFAENKRKKLVFFLLSLLLHLALFICFLFFAFPKKSLVILRKHTRELPASLKPRAGSLQDSVFFDFSPPSPAPTKEILKKAIKESTSLPKQKAAKETAMPTPKPESSIERMEDPSSKTASTKETKTKIEEEPPKPEEKKLTPEELRLLALQNLLKELPKPDKEVKTAPIKYITASELMSARLSQPSSHNLSVSIPMGVPGVFQSKGLDLAERRGDDTKKPTLEDLKYVCYLRKVAQCIAQDIQNIFNRFSAKGEGKVEVLFEIGRPGNLNAMETTISTQQQLEALMVQAIRSSAPFPPLPKYFEKEYFFSKIEIQYKNTPAYRSMSATIYALV